MEKNGVKPERIAIEQIDAAIDEAVKRAEQAKELSKDDLEIAGGKPTPGLIMPIQY